MFLTVKMHEASFGRKKSYLIKDKELRAVNEIGIPDERALFYVREIFGEVEGTVHFSISSRPGPRPKGKTDKFPREG